MYYKYYQSLTSDSTHNFKSTATDEKLLRTDTEEIFQQNAPVNKIQGINSNENLLLLPIPGYKNLEILHKGSVSYVLRAFDERKKHSVIIKIINPDEFSPVQDVKFRQDFEVRKHIDSDFIVKGFLLDFYQHRPFIVMEDFGGTSLYSYMQGQKLELVKFFAIAKKCIQILDIIHQKEVIHKDIKPCNILYNPGTDEIKFTDFGISTMLEYEHPTLLNPRILDGTIAYISPEQTGRMHKSLDYRTDYYSLGVTFYYLLSAKVPFNENSPMKMVHSHIAKKPAHLSDIDKDIPFALSNIIMKLLEKNSEDRYQSAQGLLHDIEKCQAQFNKNGKIITFSPGENDITDKFHISEKFYGRTKKIGILTDIFARVKGNTTEIVMVKGASGTGKTALVNELKKKIPGENHFFIEGKFDQLNETEAYSGIIQAFQLLVTGLLSEPEEKINFWKESILNAVGKNVKLITNLIPKLELLTGKQAEPEKSSGTDVRNRFNYTLTEFVKIFARPAKPLILFLDDMQWSDYASIELLKALIVNNKIKNLFLILSYRNNEIDQLHPFSLFLKKIKYALIPVTEIETRPVSFAETHELVADTLNTNKENAYHISSLIYKKTGANPFFIKEFLKTLYMEKLLYFDNDKKIWDWNIQDIETKKITKNVLELIIKRIKKLPKKTLEILKYASCLGNKFSFSKLFLVCNISEPEFTGFLWEAVKEGMLIPVGDNSFKLKNHFQNQHSKKTFTSDFIFQHDRVQQAAYSMIPKKQLPHIHLEIGRSILKQTQESDSENKIFEIVNQLNFGSSIINEKDEISELIKLNLKAGEKAKNASAYKRAGEYLGHAYMLLTQQEKDSKKTIVKKILKELSETEYLSGNFKRSKELLDKLIDKTDSNIEKVEVYELLILIYTMTANYEKAVLTGSKALKLLGIDFPVSESEIKNSKEVDKAIKNIMGKDISCLVNNKEMKDPVIKTAMKILLRLQATSYFFKNELYPLVLAMMTNFSLEHGNAPESAKGYGSFANIFASRTKNYQTAYKIGKLGLAISKKFKDRAIECQTRLSISAFLIHGVSHLKEGEDNIKKGYQAGLESGEIQYAGILLFNRIHNRFFQGFPLDLLAEEIPDELGFCIKTGNNIAIDVILPFKLIILNLRGKTADEFDFSDNMMDENQYIAKFYNNKSWLGIFFFRFLKAQNLFIYGHLKEALKEIELAEHSIKFSLGYFSEFEFHFYHALITASVYNESDKKDQEKYKIIINKVLTLLKQKSESVPENYLSRFLLVAAEQARIEQNFELASDLYDQAIEEAEKNNFIQIKAIANELAAKFWKSRNKNKIARPYYEDALNAYKNWGALKKIKLLEDSMPGSSPLPFQTNQRFLASTTSSNLSDSDIDYSATLDMESVTLTSQAISSEVDLGKLLKKLMHIMIENAGASKGFIILKSGEELRIEAAARADSKKIRVLESIPLNKNLDLAESVVRYVIHTDEDVLINDVSKNEQFSRDPWINNNQTKSILCTPVRHKNKTTGVFYFENNLSTNVFSKARLNVLKNNLLPQAAISIENALLFTKSAQLTKSLEKEIEHRKKVQNDLEKSEKKYREIFENTRDIYVETTPDGIILEVSPSIEETLLYRREELIGKKVSDKYFNPKDKALLLSSLKENSKISNFEVLCKNKNGENIYCSINAMLSFDKNNVPEKIFASLRDITEKKQLETRLFHSQKMDAVGTLAGGIAHDFNNILAGIIGYTDIALFNINHNPDKIPAYLKGISKASERARNLVNQILSFSRSSDTDRKMINPVPVIKEALKLLRSSIPSSVEIYHDITISSLSISANSTQIHQIIMNLCSNAAHSMKDTGGKLTIIVKNEIIESETTESIDGTVIPGSYLKISVKDTGHGIPEDIKRKIFDPYFTTKSTGEGTGLGLAMVQGIVQSHNGFFNFKSRTEKGTVFNIYLPAVETNTKKTKCSHSESPSTGNEKILLVDDEETLVEVIKDMLETFGYKVFATTSPVEALNLVTKKPDYFDLIISDMTMPVLTGDKLSEAIFKINPYIPVIICTGYNESIMDEKLNNLNIKKILIKPCTLKTLTTTIREILDKK